MEEASSLSVQEACAIVLFWSKNKRISSKTKLNKLVASLHNWLIPLDFRFELNRFGSQCLEVESQFGNSDYFGIESARNYQGTELYLKPVGEELAKNAIKKIMPLYNEKEQEEISTWIYQASQKAANVLSEEEHINQLYDEDQRPKLVRRVNETHIELLDLCAAIKNKKPSSEEEVDKFALIEYSYFLSKFLKEKRFKKIDDEGYEFGADTLNYYYIKYLEELVKKLKSNTKFDYNKEYQKLIASSKENYPFSLHNEDLKNIVQWSLP